VGSIRRRVLSDMQICQMYQQGFSRAEIGWKAKLYDPEILVILRANGIALRTSGEARALSYARRRERERLRGLTATSR
jgi:hypothetical protein